MPRLHFHAGTLAGWLLAACVVPATTASAQQHGPAHGGITGNGLLDQPIELIPEALGPYHWPITTDHEEAQRFFDQGMQLRWAYNVDEAARSMMQARTLDPACAMCWWGEAFALGSYLNAGMSVEKANRARTAILRAMALLDRASPVEQALIRATAVRYPADYDPDARRPVDQAFADAMAEVHAAWPDHHEVATIYAVSLFLLEERRGYRDITDPDLQKLHAVLRDVIDEDPSHPGACHLYIHATESSQRPELGLPCADMLGRAVPVASHIQHMPSHTWNELGLWGRSVEANQAAWASDLAAREGRGFSYAPTHNLHMLLFAASFDGQGEVALQAGRDYRELSGDSTFEVLTLVRFGRFEALRALEAEADTPLEGALLDFGQGYAALRTGDPDEARVRLERLQGYVVETEDRFRFHAASTLVGSLAELLAGELRREEGDLEGAIAAFERAVALEDSLDYDEPEPLPFAPRHWLGAALLEAGRGVDAELVYRTELADHPHNGWSLYGVVQALALQGRSDAAVERDLVASWARADVELSGSRF